MIWNANCDSARPKTKRELLQDLETWERTQGGHAPTASTSVNLGAEIKDKNFDGARWGAKHSDSFNDLISQALKSQNWVDEGLRNRSSPSSGATDSQQLPSRKPDERRGNILPSDDHSVSEVNTVESSAYTGTPI